MLDELEKYTNDHFFYNSVKPLEEVCNAPKTGSGVYVVYSLALGNVNLVYVDSYGEDNEGLYNSILKDSKLESWKVKFLSEQIDAIDIYWFETNDDKHSDDPIMILDGLFQDYLDIYGELPPWNND